MDRKALKIKIATETGRSDTLNVLSELLGITTHTASNKLTGKFPFDAREIRAIKERFGLTADETIAWLL